MKNQDSNILVVGSVVKDIVYLRGGAKRNFFGGTGANISYGLGILKIKSTLFSVAGKDFNPIFSNHLKKYGIDLKVCVDKNAKTAVFSVVENAKGKNKEIWWPNGYAEIENIKLSSLLNKKDFSKIKIAIFSPGTAVSTVGHLKEFNKNKKKGSIAIFDPGQMTDYYSQKQFKECCALSDILILNELEFKQSNEKLNGQLLKIFKNKILIQTLGHRGSIIYQNGGIIFIRAVKPKRVVNVVGAGDAYRAGLIYGLHKGKTLEESCRLGARMASKNVEFLGCQKYSFKLD